MPPPGFQGGAYVEKDGDEVEEDEWKTDEAAASSRSANDNDAYGDQSWGGNDGWGGYDGWGGDDNSWAGNDGWGGNHGWGGNDDWGSNRSWPSSSSNQARGEMFFNIIYCGFRIIPNEYGTMFSAYRGWCMAFAL